MAVDRFVIDSICHPYNFSEENLKSCFERIFNDVLYAFHPLLDPPETVPSKDEWQHDWQNDEFLEPKLLVITSGKHFDAYTEPELSEAAPPAVEWFGRHLIEKRVAAAQPAR